MKKLFALSIFLFTFAFVGCVQHTDDGLSPEAEAGMSVEEAQAHFDAHAEALNLPSQLVPQSSQTGTRGDHVHGPECNHDHGHGHQHTRSAAIPGVVLTPNWRKATAYSVNGLGIVEAPILLNTEMIVRRNDMFADANKALYRSSSESRLIEVRHADGQVQMFMATLVPDLAGVYQPAKNTKFLHPENNFSGLVFFSELNGLYGEVWQFVNGKKARRMAAIPQNELSKEQIEALSEKTIIGTILENTGVSTRWDSEYDPSCPFCYPGDPCMVHGGIEIDEIVVTPDPCPWCGKTTCTGNCIFTCSYCGKLYCFGECQWGYYCSYCGSPYCFGECMNPPPPPGGGGGGYYPPYIPPKDDDGGDEEEEEDGIPMTGISVKINGSNSVVLGTSYGVSITKIPSNTTDEVVSVKYTVNNHSLGTFLGSASAFYFKAKSPGDHVFKATATTDKGATFSATSSPVTHRFPTASEVKTQFEGDMENLWTFSHISGTLTETREFAAVMWLDTRENQNTWQFISYPSDPYPYSNQTFGAPFPSSYQESYSTNPEVGGKWVVGIFHTHPSWQHAFEGRFVGRSSDDGDPGNGIPAWVMDYDTNNTARDENGITRKYITPQEARRGIGELIKYGGNGRISPD